MEHNDQSVAYPCLLHTVKDRHCLDKTELARSTETREKIFLVKNGTNTTLQEVLDHYSEVFRDELGMMTGVTAKIHLGPEDTPRFHKARSVPFAL